MHVYIGASNCVSPLGITTNENFSAIVGGKTAVKPHQFSFSENAFVCSRMDENELNNALSSIGGLDKLTRLEKMSVLSIGDVINHSSVQPSDKDTLLILSTTKGNIDVLENKYPQLPPGREYLAEYAKVLGDFFHCANTPLLVSNACISGLLAIIIAKRLIESKKYKHVLVSGADLVSEFTLSGFKSFSALSDEMCKPFDKNRKGINLGEGAATLLLSSDPISNIVISGGASANDANHISGPSRTGDGLFQAISGCTAESGLNHFDFINAHGTATEFNDEMESVAFSRAGLHHLPVNSFKAYYGHTLGAAGVLECVLAIEELKQNTLLRSLGYETKGTSHLDNVISKTEQKELNACLKTASGFGGCNAAAAFEKI